MSKDLPKTVLLLLLDEKQCKDIESALTEAGYEVTIALDRHLALKLMREENPQFIIMDSATAAIGDIVLCRDIRSEMNMPETRIVTLSERQHSQHKPQSPEIEADFDLGKPFAMKDLLEVLASLQYQRPARMSRKVLRSGAIEMLPEKWVVYVEGASVNLTEKEYRLLQELMEVKGRVLTREALLERVWGYPHIFNLETRTLDVHMSRLRRKLGSSADNIITVRNVGYRMCLTPDWLGHL